VRRLARSRAAASLLAAALWLPAAPLAAASEADALWARLREGRHVLLVRHAAAPGVNDPPGFRLDDCATQRNLSAAGREQARRLGEAFRVRGVPVGRVLSSRWCRCIETARLAFGRTEPWPDLDSLRAEAGAPGGQTARVAALAGNRPEGGNLVLVTHQRNITALTGLSLAEGATIVLEPRGDGGFDVAGRLAPPERRGAARPPRLRPNRSARTRRGGRRSRRGRRGRTA
jgi:phosphohistidine phosphatase SixA